MGCCGSKNQKSDDEAPSVPAPKPQLNGTALVNRSPPAIQEPSPRAKKRALLCGVSYKNSKYELKGTINDVNNIKDLLINHYGFLENNMRILTEEKENSEVIPTRENIEKGLQWLVEGCSEGDSLVFYFAGHGSGQQDCCGDEIDGYDETICPVDFVKAGEILDNYINSTIVRPLKKGVTLHAIVDACHSGTILDLNHVYDRDMKRWKDNKPPSGVSKATDGGLAISISACEDHQEAGDTSAWTQEAKSMNGAMTYILTDLVKQHKGLTYGDLIDLMHEAIEDANKNKDGGHCLSTTNILKKMFGNKISQKPQLSSSENFDVYKKHFQL